MDLIGGQWGRSSMPIYDRLSALSDTNIGSASNGQTLLVSGGLWSNVPMATALADNAALANNGGVERLKSITTGATTYTINLADGNVFELKLTGAGTITLSFTGATPSRACSFTLYLVQPPAAAKSVVWPGSVKWASGTPPALSSNASKVDILVFETINGGTTWFGSLVGTNFS